MIPLDVHDQEFRVANPHDANEVGIVGVIARENDDVLDNHTHDWIVLFLVVEEQGAYDAKLWSYAEGELMPYGI
jgi:hypothetical protein